MRPSNYRHLRHLLKPVHQGNKKPVYSVAIFDFDGTLADTEGHSETSLTKAVKLQKDLHLTAEQQQEVADYCYGRSLHAILDYISTEFALDHQRLITEYRDIWQQALHQDMAIADSVTCAKYLHQNDFELSICTGSEAHQINGLLNLIGIEDLFSHLITAENYPAEHGKPHPRPFELAIEHHQIDPANAVVFEDSINGVTAAKAANIGCIIALTDNKEYGEQLLAMGANQVVDSLHHDDVYQLLNVAKPTKSG
ncbi:MAG: HAD family phosphatase [Coxiellaceae bacterium]|nr:HAD family phosphatase [Coxiellaceae bacterium]